MHNPYEILGIESDADKRTIKHAYAKLVKQYHPEEQPEEWKRIHDAYEQAMELVSAKKQKVSVPVPQNAEEQEWELTNSVNISEEKKVPNTPTGIPEQEKAPNTPIGMPEQKQAPNAPIGTPAPKIRQEVPETEAEDIFGDVDEIAGRQREQEERAAKEKLESAIHEMRQLIWDNKFQKKEWKKFFERNDLLPVISQKKFLRELGDCFELKQIDPDLYSYLNEQLEAIAEYIKEYNTDLTRSRDLAAVKYAKTKVRLAHKRYAKIREERKEKLWGKWTIVMFIIGIIVLSIEGQKKEEERQRQEVITEWQDELMKQNAEETQKQAQDMLNADPDLKEEMIERMKKDLRSGEITQEFYDFFIEYYGIDQTQPETETTEESTDADTK